MVQVRFLLALFVEPSLNLAYPAWILSWMMVFAGMGKCAADGHRRRFYELTRYVKAA
jgi:hypothetical protein